MPTSPKKSAPRKPTPKNQAPKEVDERARLITKLGEELWSLLETKSLPVPTKLKATVEALRALQAPTDPSK